ncbi:MULTISPECIES: DUF2127 domain-containing protein [Stenotrophomonas]|uniref:DUF2127 domain-containing protein n=1 Tax=Stenotrophomonas TaxID=40323 RepID=UPI000BC971FA|nr:MULTISPECIES: DUF2127 domain-containing protein [Stenotrophomonas]MCA7024460.1 DUF2127 domain-containing protein [Stenotrophomonas acidaminiphila]MCE4074752.1 DUF2127 domain-containing protein [Stenotrophomonas acidaminiphila]OZB53811.1 MAG: hypothetical protein B7X38_03180 [Stenotrophomonas sp. 14-69-23]
MSARKPYNPDPHAHPGLAAIALLEAVKAALAFLAAAGLEFSGPAPLRTFVNTLIRHVGGDPEHGSSSTLLDMITPDTVHVGALALVAYGLLRSLEAWGLWRARAWASWLGCISAALYLPLDVYAIIRHPGWASWLLLAVNLVVVWVLARDIGKRRPATAR